MLTWGSTTKGRLLFGWRRLIRRNQTFSNSPKYIPTLIPCGAILVLWTCSTASASTKPGNLHQDFLRRRTSGCPHLPDAIVNLAIFPSRRAPGKVSAHAVAHQDLPGRLVAISKQRLLGTGQQCFAGVFGELEARAL